MARSVYADPFGAYTNAYNTGVTAEQNVQQNVRAARDSDFKYYNLDPLTLQHAQRENSFEQYALPYRKELIPIGVDNAKASSFGNAFTNYLPAAYLGQPAPLARALGQATGQGYTLDSNGNIQFVTPQTGTPSGPQITNQMLLDAYPGMRQEQRTIAGIDWQHQQQDILNQIAEQNADSNAIRTNAYNYSVVNGYPTHNGGVAAPNPTSYFGMGAPSPGGIPMTAPQAPQAPPTQAPDAQAAMNQAAMQLLLHSGVSPQVIQSGISMGITPQQMLQQHYNQSNAVIQ
jgi:hypothetical protein